MLDRLSSLLVALTLACLAWLYARSRDPETLDNVPIPVQLSLAPSQAEHYDLEVTGPAQVAVTFMGPPSRIRELRESLQHGDLEVNVPVVVPDERKTENRYLDTVRVDSTDVHAPPGVTAVVLEGRNRIPITLRRIVQRRLPVHLDPTPDERISRASVEPETVLVRGPKVILDRVRFVPTQPCLAVTGNEQSGEPDSVNLGAVPLVRELEGRPITCTPDAVSVRLALRPRERQYDLAAVPVRFLCPAGFELRPQFLDAGGDQAAIHLSGPADEPPSGIVAYVDLTRHPFKPGIYVNEPLDLRIPQGFRLSQPAPPSAPFQLSPWQERGEGRMLQKLRGW